MKTRLTNFIKEYADGWFTIGIILHILWIVSLLIIVSACTDRTNLLLSVTAVYMAAPMFIGTTTYILVKILNILTD